MSNMSYRSKPEFSTLVELLRWRAEYQPDQLAYIFLVDGKTEGARLSFAELDQRAQAIAAQLQSWGAAGERALLFFPPGLDFVISFLGCLYAGTIAVPVNFPGAIGLARNLPRLQAIVADAQATMIFTTAQFMLQSDTMFQKAPDLKACRWIVTDDIEQGEREGWQEPALDGNSLAFIQYTSGSTRTPKGVMISHSNVLHNCLSFQQTAGLDSHGCMVSWLPHFHDMGLVLSIIQSLYTGMRCVLMSPTAFIKRPYHWLQAISRYRGTVSCAPNFAYELCIEKVTSEQRATLDLSSWEVAASGAEPVRSETLKRFTETFAFCGFRKEAFCPGYGLAEATVMVSCGPKTAEPVVLEVQKAELLTDLVVTAAIEEENTRIFVGCGKTSIGQKIIIVNPESSLKCQSDQVGEIWVSGPSVSEGYWNRPKETEKTFRGKLAETGEGPFLRTGDLGFLKDGELFITGRIKDVLIFRGGNYYPQDIELTVQNSHMALHPGSGAAFSVDVEGEERLVVLHAVRNLGQDPNAADVIAAIRQAISEEHDLQAYAVVLTRPRSILKTSSGKIQRQACKAAYFQGTLQIVAQWQATIGQDAQELDTSRKISDILYQLNEVAQGRRDLIETYLIRTIAKALHVGEGKISANCNYRALGLDSIRAMELLYVWERDLGIKLTPEEAFEQPTARSLARRLANNMLTGKGIARIDLDSDFGTSIVPDPEQLHLPFPLTDIQHAYWVGRTGAVELGNVSCHLYLEIESEDLVVERLSSAWQQLIERHDMLRAVILPDGQQKILEHVPPYKIDVLDLRRQVPEAQKSHLEAIRHRMSHQVLRSEQWPLFEIRASCIDDKRIRLHISLDLLIVDAGSIKILTNELLQLYQHLHMHFPPLTLSFRDYVLAKNTLTGSNLYKRSREYWMRRLPTLPPAPELPLKKNPGSVTQPRFVRRSHRLEPEVWSRLKNRAEKAGLTPSGTLLAAFAEVLSVWSKSPRFTLNLTSFDRLPLHPQAMDIVGDFTSMVLLEVNNSGEDAFELWAKHLQKQLWDDLYHRYFSGVEVLRELSLSENGTLGVTIPVVFTSTIGLETNQDNSVLANIGDVVYAISQTPQVWLDHQVFEVNGALVFNWDAVEELFSGGLLDDMFDAYCRLLQRLADEEKAWQETTCQLIPAAQLENRAAANATESPVSSEMLHTLFTAQVFQQPGHLAVISSNRTLSYEELSNRSNHVGRLLREKGAQPNALVAVVMEKGWEQVVAVLGILNSGAAYLPIDPTVPKKRFYHLLKDGEVSLVLTQSLLDEKLEWPECIQRFSLDKMDLTDRNITPLEPVQRPEDLAYVIYTSGSTGFPKGVMIDHRGAVNTILDVNRRFRVGPEDKVHALSNLNFDLSVYDIFGTLAAGGTIVLPDAGKTREPDHWLELMTQEQVTIWNSVPALMQMFVEYASGRREVVPQSLRLVLLSGDWIPLDLPDKIKTLVQDVQVISLGGATEASIWSNVYPIEEVDPDWKSIPYGHPMVNQRYYVLKELMEDCPDWVPGQLYIGGIGLAKGYWHDEEKTRNSFIIHPNTKERLYRTGDLGRYLPDGNIEFLGREDFQVKISGYRIELGEIETTLKQHPGVSDAVVTAVGDQKNKRLVGYLVPDQEKALNFHKAEGSCNDLLSGSSEQLHEDGVVLHDPGERIEFKLGRPGVRKGDTDSPYVQFTKPEMDEALINTYSQRLSYRKFEKECKECIEQEQFGDFLRCLLAIEVPELPFPRYRYGSAGGLYPTQTYLYIKPDRVERFSEGIYYYHPIDHRLVVISDAAHIDRSIFPGNNEIFDEAAFAIFLIADLDAISPMYGVGSRDFCMIEAGLLTQLLETSSFTHQIGLCQIGKLDFPKIKHMFGLKNSHEYLHCLLGGRVNQPEGWSFLQEASQVIAKAHFVKPPNPDPGIIDEVSSFLKQKLPDYMVPSSFMVLDELPLSANGKLNRKALPEPGALPSEVLYIAPRTEVEQTMAAILQEVLDVEKVGIYDNFFDLGANSLHLVWVKNKVEKKLKRDVTIVDFFEHPTINLLAGYMTREGKEKSFIQQADKRVEIRMSARKKRERSKTIN